MDKRQWERMHGKYKGVFRNKKTGCMVWLGMNNIVYGYSSQRFIMDDLRDTENPELAFKEILGG